MAAVAAAATAVHILRNGTDVASSRSRRFDHSPLRRIWFSNTRKKIYLEKKLKKKLRTMLTVVAAGCVYLSCSNQPTADE